MNTYSIRKGLTKAFTSILLFAIPFALQVAPEKWLNLTVGGILVLILNFLKFQYNQNIQ